MNSYKDQMIIFIKDHPEFFDEALELAISDKQPFAWRSAWLLWSCMEKNDERIQKRIPDMIASLEGKKDGHQRELLKILYQMELTEEHEGLLFNLCSDIWEKIGKNPSVRFTAFQFIIKISRKYPELFNEIQFLMQDHYVESLSPGIRRSVLRKLGTLGGREKRQGY